MVFAMSIIASSVPLPFLGLVSEHFFKLLCLSLSLEFVTVGNKLIPLGLGEAEELFTLIPSKVEASLPDAVLSPCSL